MTQKCRMQEPNTVCNSDQHVFHDQKLVHDLKAVENELGLSEWLSSDL
jgi:hypothetical protein